MHSIESYLQGLSTPVLKGGLSGWCDGLASYVDDAVLMMVEILRSRGALDPELAASVEKRREELRRINAEKAEASRENPYKIFVDA